MQNQPLFGSQAQSTESVLATNKVLRNTYLLLSATLLFSAMTAGLAMAMEISRGTSLVLSLIGLGLIFAVHKTADSGKGLVMVFAFTGVLGAALGPMLNHYLALANGPSLVMQALAGTALVFFTLSGYALSTRKDFSFMGGFLMVGLVVVVIAGLANIFFQVPAVSLALSAAVVLIMSGLILFDTSRIVHGGETNYIRATVALYLNIYNLFTSLLHLLGVFGGED
ncbi:Bax inhibitor-1/YccA family protein [Dasania sp. GY-MA-18]|uniref:Bax inhibitor-1/YccA family protein n=1 Tax=Dasania phycosphaerae TaxID=2950436 RepID=A0A9J6RR48_9GAMM|nr:MULTISPECIES: Bax inhibitor-1/YccA family protein [Dasania]MCR8924287.1 Bax inhibitor-1/YccA family protein [Dasania sp. GY-MA-18]MCZ0866940.1 Bax inhibitor-1/YccA family protein [Dasania phycosphaerae]MCZ0870444.1 Bax inhibitor-1/YccA family protein [Dasania phycosphaerae]